MGYDAHGPTKQNESQFELIKKMKAFTIFLLSSADKQRMKILRKQIEN